ncbi:PilW family protein [Planctomycetota bacterium]
MKKLLHNKQYKMNRKGFTLAELIVALTMTVVILTAVTALTFAVSSANDAADDTNAKQAQLRYATLRITELIRHCKLICRVSENDIAIWRADDNGDGQINTNELVYIESSAWPDNFIRLVEFSQSGASSEMPRPLDQIYDGSIKAGLISVGNPVYTVLIPQCDNVSLTTDVNPPLSRFVTVSFDLTENGTAHQYQINASMRSSSENLLAPALVGIVSDDD